MQAFGIGPYRWNIAQVYLVFASYELARANDGVRPIFFKKIDIILMLDHFPRQRHAPRHAPCDMLYQVPMLI